MTDRERKRNWLRKWRKRNPHYGRDWQQRKRGGLTFRMDRNRIFGILVRTNLMEWLCRPLPNCY